MSFKPIDPKRDEVRRYLERGSVLDSLTKIFIRVIKERPDDPLEYIRNNIGVVRHQHDKYERLQQDLQSANEEIHRLRGIINSINPEVLQGSQPQILAETSSDETEIVGQETRAPAESDSGIQEANTVTNASEPVSGVNSDEQLAAAVNNCHIDENASIDVIVDPNSENANQNPSVQVEGTSAGTQ